MYTTSEVVGRRVRGILAQKLITQKAAAVALGMAQQALSSRIRGQTQFSIDELHKLAGFLQVDLAKLVASVSADDAADSTEDDLELEPVAS